MILCCLACGFRIMGFKGGDDCLVLLERGFDTSWRWQVELPGAVDVNPGGVRQHGQPLVVGERQDQLMHLGVHLVEAGDIAILHQGFLDSEIAPEQHQLLLADRGGDDLDGRQFQCLAQESALADLVHREFGDECARLRHTLTRPSEASRATASATGERDTPSSAQISGFCMISPGRKVSDRIACLSDM
jgi:hypothetical protein